MPVEILAFTHRAPVRKPAARRSTEPHLEALAEFAPVLRLHPQGLLLVVGKSSQSLTEGLALTRATVHVVEGAPAVELTCAVLHARGLPTFHTKPPRLVNSLGLRIALLAVDQFGDVGSAVEISFHDGSCGQIAPDRLEAAFEEGLVVQRCLKVAKAAPPGLFAAYQRAHTS